VDLLEQVLVKVEPSSLLDTTDLPVEMVALEQLEPSQELRIRHSIEEAMAAAAAAA
jgi:hypothetical protein